MDSIPFVDGTRLPEVKSLTDPWLMPSCSPASICVHCAAESNMRKLAVKTRRLSELDVDMVIAFRYLVQRDDVYLCSLVLATGNQNPTTNSRKKLPAAAPIITDAPNHEES